MGRRLVTLVIGLAALCAGAAPAWGEPGDLDPSFSSDGRLAAVDGGGFVARAVAVQPDGRIVVAGYACRPAREPDGTCRTSGASSFELRRFEEDGRLDRGFGRGGIVSTAVGTGRSQAFDVLLEPGGRILLAGVARDGGGRDGFALVRYDDSGAVDQSFGERGSSIVPVGRGFAGAADVEPAPGGGLVATGVATSDEGDTRFAVVRYGPQGTLDGGFGSGGVALGGPRPSGSALGTAILPGGQILAAGIGGASNAPGDARFGFARFTARGDADTGFAQDGAALFGVGAGSSFANSVAPLRDGRAVASGSATEAGGKQVMAFARLTADGRLDSTWDGDGTTLVEVGEGALAADAARDAQDRLVAFGQTASGGADWRFAVTRLGPGGLLDRDFGTGGVAVTEFPGTTMARATAGAIAPDGALVAAGVACVGGEGAQCEGGSPRLALARYSGGGAPEAGETSRDRPGVQRTPWTAVSFPGTTPKRSFRVRIRVGCLREKACRVQVAVRTRGPYRLPGGERSRRPITLAQGTVRVAAGEVETTTLRLRRTGRKLIRRSGDLAVRVSADAQGQDAVERNATLKAR